MADSFSSDRAPIEQDFRHRGALSVDAPSASLGLVERLRNGGQTDLAVIANDLLLALRIHHEWCVRHQPGYSSYGDDRVAYWSTQRAILNALGEEA